MITLVYSNQTERLLRELARDIRERRKSGAHLLEPVELVVPNQNMEIWLSLGLAQSTGVAANLRFNWLNRFISALVARICSGKMKLVDLDTAEAAILAALMDEALLKTPELLPVHRYLHSTCIGSGAGTGPGIGGRNGMETERGTGPGDGCRRPAAPGGFDTYLTPDGADLRRVQLAARLAFLFQEYTFSRPEMIAAWREGDGALPPGSTAGLPFANPAAFDPSVQATVTWQRALWRAVFGRNGILFRHPPEDGGCWVTMDLLLNDTVFFESLSQSKPPPVYLFGISYMARIFQHLLARLGEVMTLRLYTLNPCAEFWEDVETQREFYLRLDQELNRRERRVWQGTGEGEAEEDPFGLFAADTPALRYWGRPGREHVRLLGELTDCDFTAAFENPCAKGGGLLHHLQLDTLMREPERVVEQEKAVAADETLRLVAAPSVRREVEWVADEIWRLVREETGPPLRFSDVAIIVNSAGKELYLPLIEAVFASCNDLPCSITDLPGASGSRIIEAMSLLLKLPFGRFTRAEMLSLLEHPAIINRLDDLTPADLTALVERLGIVYGADRHDHAGTYIDEDVYSWDQGLRRLALGAFMTGEKSGDERIFTSAQGRWLVEEVSGAAVPALARFGLLARSLLGDARFVRRQQMTLTGWAKFYQTQIENYFHVSSGTEERDRLQLLRVLGKLEKMDLGHQVSGRVAATIAGRAIDSLAGGRGQYLSEGVVVSTFLPMRAIPFRVVFLLGLGEGLFPASAQRDALDLRAVRRRAGDVNPAERDRYMFLETLLCSRERLYLSYVNRDEHTGEPLQPSAVVQELLHILQLNYVGRDGVKLLATEPPIPLRRYDALAVRHETFFDEARAEAQVAELARAQRIQGDGYGEEGAGWEERDERDRLGRRMLRFLDRINPEHRTALAKVLALTGEPPPAAAVTATAKLFGTGGAEIIEPARSLALPVLRRFLECPLQGWAAALLGLTEVEEDPADREEEDFEINLLTETVLLSDVFYAALAGGVCPEKLYEERLLRLRLAGQIPAGAFSEAIRARHLRIIAGWRALLTKLQTRTGSESSRLYRYRLGRSHRPAPAVRVLDPLRLEVSPVGPENQDRRIVPLLLSGLTAGVLEGDGGVTAVVMRARKPPRGNSISMWADQFRYLLRGGVSLAALTAANVAESGVRQIAVLYADGDNAGGLLLRLGPQNPDQARRWLTGIAEELLAGPHAYLLPCEAVFEHHARQSKDGSTGADWDTLGEEIDKMAGNEWLRFSSLWGPVPAPRLYAPPAAAAAKQMINRRFVPFLSQILGREVFS